VLSFFKVAMAVFKDYLSRRKIKNLDGKGLIFSLLSLQ